MDALVTTLKESVSNPIGLYLNIWHDSFVKVGWYIGAGSTVWGVGDNRKSILIPVTAGQKFEITGDGTANQSYAFLKTFEPVASESVDFATGYSSGKVNIPNGSLEITAPSDATYLFITGVTGSTVQGAKSLKRLA